MDGLPPGELLPASDRDIDIDRVDLDGEAAAAGQFGGDDRGARSDERVVDRIPGHRVVLDRALHAFDRLLGAMAVAVILARRDLPHRVLSSVALPVRPGTLAHRVP